jgi:hypothetical protein
MRRIAIIGSGQAGLLAAHGLLKAGYEVTLFSDRTPEQWLHESRPTGAAGRFDLSLAYERELGLDFWEQEAPKIEGVYLTFCLQPLNPFLTLSGRFEKYALAIDLRLQSHRWLNEFAARGGTLVFEAVTLERLDQIAADHDLTVVASGRGPISQLFMRDAGRSVYDKPQRNLAMVITTGGRMDFDGLPFRPVKFNFIAPIGEAFWVPYHHKTHGPTWSLVFEAKPGGPMDRFGGAKSGAETLAVAKQVIKDLFPWDWPWARDMELADEHGWLVGAFPPTVRQPVGRLPSGRIVTPIGDTSMAFDPIAGQGANNGNKMARNLVESVVAHGERPFDAAWMEATFERFYADHGAPAYTFNNIFLEPITAAGQELLIAQYGSDGRLDNRGGKQAIANAICDNFTDPRSLTEAFLDMGKARAFIAAATGRSWRWSAAGGRLAIMANQLRRRLGAR